MWYTGDVGTLYVCYMCAYFETTFASSLHITETEVPHAADYTVDNRAHRRADDDLYTLIYLNIWQRLLIGTSRCASGVHRNKKANPVILVTKQKLCMGKAQRAPFKAHLGVLRPAVFKHGSEGAICEAGHQNLPLPAAAIPLDEPSTASQHMTFVEDTCAWTY